jgi:hypothetical protein
MKDFFKENDLKNVDYDFLLEDIKSIIYHLAFK